MLTDVGPRQELALEPRVLVQKDPVDDGDQEWKRHNGGVEERMQRLQWSREGIEQRPAANRIRERVYRRDEEVKGNAPVRQDGEVGE